MAESETGRFTASAQRFLDEGESTLAAVQASSKLVAEARAMWVAQLGLFVVGLGAFLSEVLNLDNVGFAVAVLGGVLLVGAGVAYFVFRGHRRLAVVTDRYLRLLPTSRWRSTVTAVGERRPVTDARVAADDGLLTVGEVEYRLKGDDAAELAAALADQPSRARA